MKQITTIVLFPLLFVSCKSYDSHKYGTIDAGEKSIVVPIGAQDPSRELKDELRKNGWRLHTARTGVRTSVQTSNRTETYYDKSNARYALDLEWEYRDIGFDFSRLYDYSVTLVDLKTHEEILTATGNSISIKNFNKNLMKDFDSMTRQVSR